MGDLSLRGHLNATLRLGLPLIASQLAQFLINLTDIVMIGWYGVPELAALTVAHGVLFCLIILGAGFAWAVMPLAAAAQASGDPGQVRRVTRMGLWASLGFSALVLAPLAAVPGLFLRLGQTPEVAGLAERYFDLAAVGVVPALVTMLMRSFLSALELTRIVMWATLLAAGVNAGLNWILIFGRLGLPELGVSGAALASVGCQLTTALALCVYAARRAPDYDLFRRLWRPDWPALAQVLRLGWPIGLTSLAEVGLFAASAVMMGWVGTEALAAHGIAIQCATAVFMVHMGLSQAATVRAGQAYGRRDAVFLRRAATAALVLSGAFAVISMGFLLAAPETLLRLFLDPDEPALPEIVAIGTGLLALAAAFQAVDAAQVITLGLLRGVLDTRIPMLYAALSYWGVGATLAFWLGFAVGLGGAGIWLGLVAGLGAAALLMSLRFWRHAIPALAGSRPASAAV